MESALLDDMPATISALDGITQAKKAARPVSGIFTSSQLCLTIGQSSIHDLESYLNNLCATYLSSSGKQGVFKSQAQIHQSSIETSMTPVLQTAIDGVPQIERVIDEQRTNESENSLLQAQVDALRVLSHPPFFLGAHKAIPRAKMQLKELAAVITEHKNKRRNSLKAKVNDRVKTLEVVEGIPKERNIPIGSIGVVIEAYESSEAEGYAVDFAFPDNSLVGDFAYANAYLEPDQFEVINECIEDTHQHATA